MSKPTYDELVTELKAAIHLLYEWLPDDQEEYKEEYEQAEGFEVTAKRAEGIL